MKHKGNTNQTTFPSLRQQADSQPLALTSRRLCDLPLLQTTGPFRLPRICHSVKRQPPALRPCRDLRPLHGTVSLGVPETSFTSPSCGAVGPPAVVTNTTSFPPHPPRHSQAASKHLWFPFVFCGHAQRERTGVMCFPFKNGNVPMSTQKDAEDH